MTNVSMDGMRGGLEEVQGQLEIPSNHVVAPSDTSEPVRTGELTKKIWNHFGNGYIKLTQVRAATGWADMNTADMMVMGEWPSTGNKLHGFEVKVSRADWLNEVKNPHKNDSVKKYCDLWWLVIADENMVKEGELPEDWGMMAYQGKNRKLKIVKQAPLIKPEPMDNCFVASLLRHNDKATIPVDLHMDSLRDVSREATALEKRKSKELYDFVKTMAKGFGITIKEYKSMDYSVKHHNKVFSKWEAEIKKTYLGRMDAEQLSEMLTKVSAYDSMKSEVEIIQRRLKEIIAKGGEVKSPDYVVPWAEWALKNCEKFLADTSVITTANSKAKSQH